MLFRTKVEAPAGYKQRWTAEPEVDMTEVTERLLNKQNQRTIGAETGEGHYLLVIGGRWWSN